MAVGSLSLVKMGNRGRAIRIDENGGEVAVYNKNGKVQPIIGGRDLGGKVAVYNKDGQVQASLDIIGHDGAVMVRGKNGKMNFLVPK